RLGDLVVERSRREVRVPGVELVAELDEEGQDAVAGLQAVLRPLAGGDAHGLAATAVLRDGLAGDDHLDTLLDEGASLLVDGVVPVVRPDCGGVDVVDGRGGVHGAADRGAEQGRGGGTAADPNKGKAHWGSLDEKAAEAAEIRESAR